MRKVVSRIAGAGLPLLALMPVGTLAEVPGRPTAWTAGPAKIEIPARFRGVWAFVAQRTGECRASDWKGVAASDDSLVEIGPKSLKAFESGCDVNGVKRSEGPAGEGPATMSFTCSGEGSTETVRETWDIVRHKGDELLITSQIGKPRIVAYMRCR
ncbi:hypothetical protein BHAOGJBA_4446 [Methylobacterium hispanicum]|uniref:DUF3617 family protein n=1 Tax=Methylobacterium hispanicum TaxID=270350 RepID=A0AAV4ZRS6_9HYPH|nr:hypothetical protein [Methylobacterium hispanicum]GJD90902.1 hypothetical protein BHAOGJBA_4446 [Methylobacterium hispanicum]